MSMSDYTVLMDKSTVGDKMETVLYYRNSDKASGAANIADSKNFLVPNCAGYITWDKKNSAIIPTHRHDYYLLYVDRGSMKLLSDNGEGQELHPGQFVCFFAENIYQYQTLDNGVCYYFIHFSGHSVLEILEQLGIKNSRVYTAGIIEKIVNVWCSLIAEFSHQDNLFLLRCSSKLIQILTLLSESSNACGDSLFTKRLGASIDYIHGNFNKEISIPELARLEHLSVSRYYTLFKENMGCSPSEYVIVLRMNRACTMMLQNNVSVKEIASLVGYHDAFYFSRLFKKYMGISPAEYKKQNK